eukprot:CAMPEP_0174254330 /NCGR_PEP_ID=MMETSP0439-20130205/3674_1 /TAXON_ID=0 /ORGANISM="Stereomyxa ramosa, Strain Chinc5" /LENGTH=338 /DNA_ID=CAMNT_0015335865 /DNA_START=189 /DNA_END=1202 /DNA_ORIENTATION=+
MNYIADPQDIEYMLKTNWKNFIQGPDRKEIFQELLGDGIFNADGEIWKQQRKTASHEFSVNKFKGFTSQVFTEHGKLLLERLDAYAQSGEEFDMQDLAARYTLDCIGEIAFGVSFHCLSGKEIPFARAFDRATSIVNDRFVSSTWKWRRFLGVGSEKQLTKDIKIINSFCTDTLNERRKNLSGKQDLLSRFMLLKDDDGNPLSDSYLRDIVVSFVLAGRDTTASAMCWCLYELDKNPEVTEKILEELDAVLGDEEPNYENLKDLQYLHSVLSESLRLHPPVPEDGKYIVEDAILPSGYPVKAGEWANFAPYGTGRLEEVWGKDACEFRPERWLKDGVW